MDSVTDLLVITTISISALILAIALVLSFRIYIQYRNLPSIRIVIIQLVFFAWIIAVLIHNMQLRQEPSLTSPIGDISLALLFQGLIILAYMQINPIYDRYTRFLGTLAFGGFIFVLSYALSDILAGTSYFVFDISANNIWTLEMQFYIAAIIFLSGISFVISFYQGSKLMEQFPSEFISNLSMRVINLIALVIIILAIIISIFFVLFQSIAIPFAGPSMIFLMALFSLAYVYFNATQPFIHLGNGANPDRLLQKNLISYYIGTSFDTGPGILFKDEEFLRIAPLKERDIELSIIGVITMIGLNDSFAERVSLVPIPQSDYFLALNITFLTSNYNLQDTRIKGEAPSILGVIIPTAMAPVIRNLGNLKPIIDELVRTFSTIDKITKPRIEDLVVRILHEILN